MRIFTLGLIGALLLLISFPTFAQNSAEGWYAQALERIEAREYAEALSTLRQLQQAHPNFRHMAAVQTRIAVLQESVVNEQSLEIFLRALAHRDAKNVDDALTQFASLVQSDPAGSLTDDALYITAYLQVMDRYEYSDARDTLARLQQLYPESSYSDAAQYLDAIAQEQLGDTLGARETLIRLRDKHTAFHIPLAFRWPQGNTVSRYWFDRADRRLAVVEQRLTAASTVKSRDRELDGKLRVAVSVDGVDMQLLLKPSSLIRQTKWTDTSFNGSSPPILGIYEGRVEGIDDSWVRAIIQGNDISGAIYTNGVQRTLLPGNLVGTLDYYQPRSRKPGGTHPDASKLARLVQGVDALVAPPESGLNLQSRSQQQVSSVRVVPVSIVVDSQYTNYYAGNGLLQALNSLNVADGVYRKFGLSLVLEEAISLDAATDPLALGSVTLETILRSFRDYRLQNQAQFEDSALAYLFTGNPKTDITLGLAWIGTACRNDGYDVGVTTPSTFGDVLLTHELGHSLGAQHDSDTACNSDPLSLMWPNISERTKSVFTSCSEQSIQPIRTRACLQNSVDLNLSANANGAEVTFQVEHSEKYISINAQLFIETSAPDQLQWPTLCQVLTPTSAVCRMDSVLPNERRILSLDISAEFQSSDAAVTGQLVPVGLTELQSADNQATVSLQGLDLTQLLSAENPAIQTNSFNALENENSPATGAANLSSGAVGVLQTLVFVLLLCWRWPFPIGLSSQLDRKIQAHKFNRFSRLAKRVLIRSAQQVNIDAGVGGFGCDGQNQFRCIND